MPAYESLLSGGTLRMDFSESRRENCLLEWRALAASKLRLRMRDEPKSKCTGAHVRVRGEEGSFAG